METTEKYQRKKVNEIMVVFQNHFYSDAKQFYDNMVEIIDKIYTDGFIDGESEQQDREPEAPLRNEGYL